ncbi:MAG: DinB superfamily protein [candidate division BRC1 bacterium ADurb.BinA364]|nr:MAG: DinB superfamily protein [candidate division BRC1 bacterium ADurb.BinA364]
MPNTAKSLAQTDVSAAELGAALIAECERKLFAEYSPRLGKCLGLLSEEELWRRPNDATPSAGNLVLHLCGNVRQWIGAGLGGEPDTRNRSREFEERGPVAIDALLALLDETLGAARECIRAQTAERLLEMRAVQGFHKSRLAILIHVVEHFAYHLGQISRIVKETKGIDLGYYDGFDLNAKS